MFGSNSWKKSLFPWSVKEVNKGSDSTGRVILHQSEREIEAQRGYVEVIVFFFFFMMLLVWLTLHFTARYSYCSGLVWLCLKVWSLMSSGTVSPQFNRNVVSSLYFTVQHLPPGTLCCKGRSLIVPCTCMRVFMVLDWLRIRGTLTLD